MKELDRIKYLRELLRSLVKSLGILEKNKEFCCGITYAQYCALIEIGRAKEIFLKNLAEKLNLDKSTTSRTVDNLVKLNYVKLETFVKNRRFVKIILTHIGEALFNKIEEGSEKYYKNVIELIPKDKRPQVIESIEYLIDALGKVKCCNGSCCGSNK